MARARVAFVTGGGRGLGRACALRLARDGLAVAAGSRTEAEVRAVASEITRSGGAGIAVRLDVADPESVSAAVESVESALGPVDVLVCAAGTSSSAKFLETPVDEWRRLLDINLFGAVHCVRAVLPGMVERNFGRVVAVGSVASLEGAPYVSAYAASKHALLGFVRSLAAETARKDIAVNCVCPVYVDTPMTDETVRRIADKTGRTEEESRRSVEALNPRGRLLRPEEVAETVAWLAREDAGAVSGQAVVVGGAG